MEQLFSTFGINWKLLLIQAVNFGVLLVALRYFLYGPVMKIIDDRREKIAEGVRAAEAAAQRLADAKTESEGLVGAGVREAEGLVASARTSAGARSDEIIGAAESRAEGILKEAQAHAAEAKRLALKESEREIAKAAMLAAEKILKEKHA